MPSKTKDLATEVVYRQGVQTTIITIGADTQLWEKLTQETAPGSQTRYEALETQIMQSLLRVARSTWVDFQTSIPQAIQSFCPADVPLYPLNRLADELPHGATLFRWPIHKTHQKRRHSAKADAHHSQRIPQMRGIVLYLNESDLENCRQGVRETLIHEYLHYLLHRAFCSNTALAEAVVERLCRGLNLSSPPPLELRTLPWHFSEFWGSSGLRTDDCADFQRSPAVHDILTLTSLGDLRTIPVECIWKLCHSALLSVTQTQEAPSSTKLFQLLISELGSANEHYDLTTFSARRLTAGTQGFYFPYGEGKAYLVTVNVMNNPAFTLPANCSSSDIQSRCQFLIDDATVNVSLVLDDGGLPIDLSLRVKGVLFIDVVRIAKDLRRRGLAVESGALALRGNFFGHAIELKTPPDA